MKVIGAGLLRTGTLSTLTALVANILKKAGYCRNRGHPPAETGDTHLSLSTARSK